MDNIIALIRRGEKIWAELLNHWDEFALPGSKHYQEGMLIHLLLGKMPGDAQTISRALAAAQEKHAELMRIGVALSDSELVEQLIVLILMEEAKNQANGPGLGYDPQPLMVDRLRFSRIDPTGRVDVPATEIPEQSAGCIHVGKDGKCVTCTDDETRSCTSCDEDVVLSKMVRCKEEGCASAFCPDCAKDKINRFGFCEDCESVDCDGCGEAVLNGEQVKCANPECDHDYHKECADRLLNSQGLCPECSVEEVWTCDDCGEELTSSRMFSCTNKDCGNCYCLECRKDNLDKQGFCADCRDVECSWCGEEVPRNDTFHCGNPECEFTTKVTCLTCRNRLMNNRGYCPECTQEEVVQCKSCFDIFLKKDLKACEQCGQHFCEECIVKGFITGRCASCRKIEKMLARGRQAASVEIPPTATSTESEPKKQGWLSRLIFGKEAL